MMEETGMCKRNRLYLGLLALCAVLLCGCGGGEQQEGSASASGAADVSASGPEPVTFEGTDLEGGAVVSSELFAQSKLTMVNVWATYCNPCLSEMPSLGELAAEYDGAEFQIIGIVSDVREGDGQEVVESLVQQTGAAYPHLLLNESVYYALLTEVSAVPTTFFVDGEGVVLDTVIGAQRKDAWKEAIDGLLEGL